MLATATISDYEGFFLTSCYWYYWWSIAYMSVNLTHFTGFICSFSFFYFLRFSAPPFCLCLSIFVNHFFHTKLFCKVHGWTGMVGEGLVILRNLTGQSSVSNENEPVGCCQCLWSWWAVGQVCLPPGKCSVWQNTSPAPVVPQSCCFFFLIFGSDGAFGLQNTIQYIKIQYIHYEGCSSLAEKVWDVKKNTPC